MQYITHDENITHAPVKRTFVSVVKNVIVAVGVKPTDHCMRNLSATSLRASAHLRISNFKVLPIFVRE